MWNTSLSPVIYFVFLCSVFQVSCIKFDGKFNTGFAASTVQMEDSVSSGMLLTTTYIVYFQEFGKWPDSYVELLEYYRKRAETDTALRTVHQQLEEFTEVKVIGIEKRVIELEFKRPSVLHENVEISGASGNITIDADYSKNPGKDGPPKPPGWEQRPKAGSPQ